MVEPYRSLRLVGETKQLSEVIRVNIQEQFWWSRVYFRNTQVFSVQVISQVVIGERRKKTLIRFIFELFIGEENLKRFASSYICQPYLTHIIHIEILADSTCFSHLCQTSLKLRLQWFLEDLNKWMIIRNSHKEVLSQLLNFRSILEIKRKLIDY